MPCVDAIRCDQCRRHQHYTCGLCSCAVHRVAAEENGASFLLWNTRYNSYYLHIIFAAGSPRWPRLSGSGTMRRRGYEMVRRCLMRTAQTTRQWPFVRARRARPRGRIAAATPPPPYRLAYTGRPRVLRAAAPLRWSLGTVAPRDSLCMPYRYIL